MDFTDDNSAFVYTYTCPPYSEDCVDGIATDYVGWLVFALMMIGNVGSDFISGIKLLILTGSRTKIVSLTKRTRLFIGGSCLCFVSCLTVLTSLVYNVAIAKTNPDIVGLTCLILFTTIYVLTYLSALAPPSADYQFYHHSFHQ